MESVERHLYGASSRALYAELPRRLYGDRYPGESAPEGLVFFVVRGSGGAVRARAAVWTNPELVHEGTVPGLIGSFESEDDLAAARTVLAAAEAEIAAAGIRRVIGPLNGTTWAAYRIALAENAPCLFPLEPMNPPYYAALWEACGYGKLADYSSSSFPLEPGLFADLGEEAERLKSRGIAVADFRPESAAEDLEAIYALSLEGFSRNFVYAPFPRADFLAKYQPIAARMRPHDAAIARDASGRAVAFAFGFPNAYAAPGEEYVIKSAAVLDGMRGLGLGGHLVRRLAANACADGFRIAYHALMHEANVSNHFGRRVCARTCRRYRLYIKDL